MPNILSVIARNFCSETITDKKIEDAVHTDPDAVLLDASFWEEARLVMPEPKKSISLRVDNEVLDWFKSRGRGYQTRMNAVLSAYVKAQKKLRSRKR